MEAKTQNKLIQLSPEQLIDKSLSIRNKSEKVTDFGNEFIAIVGEMVDVLKSNGRGIGLAAPQIGYNLQVFIVNVNENHEEPTYVFVNPEITRYSEEKDTQLEACLSLPDFQGEVERAVEIEVRYQDVNGVDRKLVLKDFLARIFQHEIDHLNGILYPDRMEDVGLLEKSMED